MIANDLEERFRKLRRESSSEIETLQSEVQKMKDEVLFAPPLLSHLSVLSDSRLSTTEIGSGV
jgi:hypothetical protein